MSQTITITTKTIAEQLGEYFYRLTNFDTLQSRYSSFPTERKYDVELFDFMLASESVLAEEWNTQEEDEAWADL
ncbi:MAG: hypothetical protein ACR2MG_01135 [Pyrinomonadaceae bacterium]